MSYVGIRQVNILLLRNNPIVFNASSNANDDNGSPSILNDDDNSLSNADDSNELIYYKVRQNNDKILGVLTLPLGKY